MSVLIYIIIGLVVLNIIGKLIQKSQDNQITKENPNHPSKYSKKHFPVGSGNCPARGNDRHIWDYGHYSESMGPSNRACKYCGKRQYFLLTVGTWNNTF